MNVETQRPCIVIEDGAKNRLIDPKGRQAFDLTGMSENRLHVINDSLYQFEEQQPQFNTKCCVEAGAMQLEHCSTALAKICEALISFSSIDVELHLETPLSQTTKLLNFIGRFREHEIARGPIKVCGEISDLPEEEMENLLNAGCSLYFLTGLSGQPIDRANLKALRSLTDFGFLVPVGILVSEKNIGQLEDCFPKISTATRSAGLGLPLISTSPYYRFGDRHSKLPDAEQYCDLLVRYYENYRTNDHVFAPINDIATLFGQGGTWSNRAGFHSRLNAIVDSQGRIVFYRHAPSLGIAWRHINEIVQLPPAQVSKQLCDFVRVNFSWNNNDYCGDCRWRLICGGVDAFSRSVGQTDLDAMCHHRKLFLEHFASAMSVAPISKTEIDST